jgi:hypothetical protein
MKTLIALLLIAHGLITAAFSAGCFKPGAPVQNPSWLTGWPTGMGQSWLLTPSGLERAPVTTLGGLLFLVSGAALIGAGLSLLGWLVPPAWTHTLALTGAGLGLFMLVLYLHPFYLIGIAADAGLLASVLWVHWPAFMSLPG